MCVANHVIFFQNMFSHVVTLFFRFHDFHTFGAQFVTKCTFLQLQKNSLSGCFSCFTPQLELFENATIKQLALISVPVYVTGSLQRPRLPSGLLDFVFYLIPTFLLRSDRPMKKPILEVGFQSSFIKIDGN